MSGFEICKGLVCLLALVSTLASNLLKLRKYKKKMSDMNDVKKDVKGDF